MIPGDENSIKRSQIRVGDARLLRAQRQLSVLVLAMVALVILLQIGGFFSDIIRILGFSILFSYLFINVVDILEKVLRHRAIAILIVYLLLAIAIAFGAIILVPAVVYQVSQLVNATFNQLPSLIDYLVKALEPLETRLHEAQIQVKAIDILTNIAASIPKPDPTQLIWKMTDVAMSTMTWLFYGLSIVVVSFYFLLDGHNIKESIIKACPKRHYTFLTVLSTDMDLALQAFFRGQIVLGLLFGAYMVAVYMALGVHYALLLGLFLGVWEIVPVIGPTIGFIPTVFSVAMEGMTSVSVDRVWQVVLVFLVFNLMQWLKDNFIAPRYIGNVIGLHPVMIFIAIMIGARLDGMLGVIYSLPVACVVNVLITHLMARAAADRQLDADQLALGSVQVETVAKQSTESSALSEPELL